MSLTPTDIQRLAQLSRLSFDPPASQRMLEGLNNFFAIVEAFCMANHFSTNGTFH